MYRYALALALAAACLAEVRTSRFQNRDAWTVEGPRLRVTLVQGGGHVGEIVLRDGPGVNPLWIQTRPTIDPDRYDEARHETLYGGGSGARLMSGLLGHNVCFPFWGNPSPAEARAGMTYHGETGIARWRLLSSGGDTLTVTAELPESRTRFTRAVRVRGQIAYFEETGANQAAWDRPVGWCEHVTLGPPFLDQSATLFDASLTRGRDGDWAGSGLRAVRTPEGGAGFVRNFLVDPSRDYGFFTAANTRLRLLIGYLFRRADFPWLNVWEAHAPDMFTRGMEFSNTPVHGTMRALVEHGPLFQTPVYEWLDARGSITKRYCAFTTVVPADYRGVADVRLRGDSIEIVERDTGRTLALGFDPRLLP